MIDTVFPNLRLLQEIVSALYGVLTGAENASDDETPSTFCTFCAARGSPFHFGLY